jgi:hypothetical protein
MTTKLQMTTQRRFGRSNLARLNPPLLEALGVSGPDCETCRDIAREVESIPEGGEFVEAASFPGMTVQKLDAHFKSHWRDDYLFVDLSAIKAAR